MMIAVRIPDEIKKYKEKIIWGLNARQLISLFLGLLICAPTYYYGRKYLSEDLLSWVIILVALPLVGIGFFSYNGMPMEKYLVALIKFNVLFPRNRKFKIENAFRDWQNEADKQDTNLKNTIKNNRIKELASLERAYLMEKAEKENTTVNLDRDAFLTVRENRQKERGGDCETNRLN